MLYDIAIIALLVGCTIAMLIGVIKTVESAEEDAEKPAEA